MSETTAEILRLLREQVAGLIGPSRYSTWFGDGTDFELNNGALNVVVPNEFIGRWIATNHLKDIVSAVQQTIGRDVRVDIRVQPRTATIPQAAGERNGRASAKRSRPRLRHRLDGFVVGSGNRLAHAAAVQLVASPGRAFRLLVLYGACGLGKTHLLQGICNGVAETHPHLEWLYVSGEEFTNDFISAVRSNRIEQFRARFRNVDLLVIDDIHFLANKPGTQDEFLHTFNAIDAAGRTVVVSSDRSPRAIASLSEPLMSRLVSGFVVELQQPDYTTRREILQRRASQMSCRVPENVLDLVARNVAGNVRDLEGALYRLAALVTLTNEPLTVDLARLLLDDQITRAPRRVDQADIEEAVAEYFNLSRHALHSKRRDRTAALARGVAMYLVRRHTSMSFPEIGRSMGKKNHSTVLMATRRIERWVESNATVAWGTSDGEREAPIRTLLASIDADLSRPGNGAAPPDAAQQG